MDLRFLHLRNVRYFVKRKLLPAQRPTDRGVPPRGLSSEELKRGYQQSGLETVPDSFILYRIIGNDLPPRHLEGQSLANLAFILRYEPELSGCEKRFVVNRIVDPTQEQAIVAILQQYGANFVHIPFKEDEYKDISWDTAGVPSNVFPYTNHFSSLSPIEHGQLMMRVYRFKNNYVMHNNGARNTALREGRTLAKWVLPWDGNCFFTPRAWDEVKATVTARPEIPYYLVPMARVTDNSLLLNGEYVPPAMEEPQIIFRCDTTLEFDAVYPYGRRSKVELLWRLGVPGRWNSWIIEPWDLPCPPFSREVGQFRAAGWVARLFSGRSKLEKGLGTLGMRGEARTTAVIDFLDALDSRLSLKDDRIHQPVYIPSVIGLNTVSESIDHQNLIRSLLNEAEHALLRGPHSVVVKRTLPSGGNKHDYWLPIPSFRRILLGFSGLKLRAKRRVSGTKRCEPLNGTCDITRLQRLFEDTFLLSLAWHAVRDRRYASHAALLIRRWFLDPENATTPLLEYAQGRRGRYRDCGADYGIIKTKDMYFFLDALRMLRSAEILANTEWNQLEERLGRFLQWLVTSPQGCRERSSANYRGTYYDLQVAAIALYLGEERLLRRTLLDSRFRLQQQFDADGRQIEEMVTRDPPHHCCFNLQGWIHLAILAEASGEDLWHHAISRRPVLQKAMHWLLRRMSCDWADKHVDEFDVERLYPIYSAHRSTFGLSAELDSLNVPSVKSIKPIFDNRNGILPFWQFCKKTSIFI